MAIVLVQDLNQASVVSDDEMESFMHAVLEEVHQKNASEVVLMLWNASEDNPFHNGCEPEDAWDTSSGSSYWAQAEEVIRSRSLKEL